MADWLSSTEFARAAGLTPQRVRQLLAAGKVPGARRIGERWAIPADAAILRVPAGRPVGVNRLSLAAAACLKALRAAKVNALVTGSAASGAAHAGSDLDLLVLAHPGRSWAQVEEIAYAAAAPYGVPVDVVFIETLPPAVRTVMLRQAHEEPRVREHFARLVRATGRFNREYGKFLALLERRYSAQRTARRKGLASSA